MRWSTTRYFYWVYFMAMINPKEIDSLRHTEYNSDSVVMEMLDTLEALWKVARAAEEFQKEWYVNGPMGDVNDKLIDALAALKEPSGKGEE